jgi:hypothetical protein
MFARVLGGSMRAGQSAHGDEAQRRARRPNVAGAGASPVVATSETAGPMAGCFLLLRKRMKHGSSPMLEQIAAVLLDCLSTPLYTFAKLRKPFPRVRRTVSPLSIQPRSTTFHLPDSVCLGGSVISEQPHATEI